jgi:hypothetical protein
VAGLEGGTFDDAVCCGPGQAEGGTVGERDRLGQRGEPDRGGHRDVLGERAVAQVGLGDRTEHPIPDRVAVDTRADGVDLAGEVLAEHEREPVLHEVLGVASAVPAFRLWGGFLGEHIPQVPGDAAQRSHGGVADVRMAQEQKSWASRVRTVAAVLVPERLTHSTSAWAPSPSGP